MAGDIAAFPYSTTRMTLFFFSLLLASHFAMAVPQRAFSSLSTSTKDNNTKKKNTTVVAATSARSEEGSTQQNLKTTSSVTPKQPLKGIREHSHRAPRPPTQRRNKIFNGSEHEVPSGPNPISNR
ncbi:CLAVATA3/ESR (CLE)-related protein TDIF-like [Lotus japonicus]|uniref:CLAVATA3/ESR (CLE)-related protein TDIF-like n=1 Tax=Lotus japonicus TaxID=34305 RepID=UPI002583F97F|nr:CLAVATA3/ESR (CLE)-related protein TDIF-like [Lotus japonicus]